MARYITLINFTDQGIKTIKDWDKRMTATKERLERAGGKLVDVYLTSASSTRSRSRKRRTTRSHSAARSNTAWPVMDGAARCARSRPRRRFAS